MRIHAPLVVASIFFLVTLVAPTEALAQAILPVSRGGTGTGSFTVGSLLFYNGSTIPGCIIMGDSDGSGVSYLTVNDGVLSVSTTAPSACQ